MKKLCLAICTGTLLLSAQAQANLCDSVKDTTTTAETQRDVGFYQELFPDAALQGNRRWNEIVLQCNRQRDTKGNEIGKVTKKWAGLGKELFTSADNYVIALNETAAIRPDAAPLLLAAGIAIDTVYKEK